MSSQEQTLIHIFDYNQTHFKEVANAELHSCAEYSQSDSITWIDIDSNKDLKIVETIALNFDFHPLMKENILDKTQRPKFEDFDKELFVLLKFLKRNTVTQKFDTENISVIFGQKAVVSFQEKIEGDAFENIRSKIRNPASKIRKSGTDFLVYTLLDATIESYFNLLEDVGEQVEQIETTVMSKPDSSTLRQIYRLKRDIMYLRKVVWPMRELINNLIMTDSNLIKETTKIYLRDVYQHASQVLDTIEINREMLTGMLDVYLSSISYRMNAVMKVLTIISTIFIPLTFITSIYGMNFEYIPELKWKWGYFFVWGMVFVTTVVMLSYFKIKKWF